jgi:hypothetical protein
VADDRRRDHVADRLRLGRVLEGDADDAAVRVEGGPAAVPRVDRRVDLQREQVRARVLVDLELDPRDDARRHAERVAALGVADDDDRVAEVRHAAQLERADPPPKLRVVDREQREVALVRDRVRARDKAARRARLAHLDEGGVGDDVGIGEDEAAPPLGDRQPRARRRLGRVRLPRQLVVGPARDSEDLDDRPVAAVLFGVGVVGAARA